MNVAEKALSWVLSVALVMLMAPAAALLRPATAHADEAATPAADTTPGEDAAPSEEETPEEDPQSGVISLTLDKTTFTYNATASVDVTFTGTLDGVEADFSSYKQAFYTDEECTAVAGVLHCGSYYFRIEDPASTTVSPAYEIAVEPATLTATYAGETITYGDEPALTVEVTGFAEGEDATTAKDYVAPAIKDAPTSCGTYTLAMSAGSAADYSFAYVSGVLTIEKAEAAIAVDSKSKTFGEADPELTYTVTGLKAEGDLGTISCVREVGEDVGTYTISVSYTPNENYNVSLTEGALTIEMAKVAMPEAASGLVYTGKRQYGVAAGDLCKIAGIASAVEAGNYTATVSLVDPKNSCWTDGTNADLTINWAIAKAPLIATYSGETVAYGVAPLLAVKVTGFVNGENESSAVGYVAPKVSSPTTEVGNYVLSPQGGAANNYSFSYVPGTLSIAAKVCANPMVLSGLTYTGTELTGVIGSAGCTVANATAIDAGDYTAICTLQEGYKWADGSTSLKILSWSIAKASYDKTPIFESAHFVYDATEKSIAVENVPDGVVVTYSGNGKINAGTYEVTASFAGSSNYKTIKALKALLVIEKAAQSSIKVKTTAITAKGVKNGKLSKKVVSTLKASGVKASAKTTWKATVPKAAKKYVTVSKAGKVTVKKGLKKGTYKLTVKATAAATTNYKSGTASGTVTLKVK